MANVKFSELPAVSAAAMTDQYAVNQSGTSKRVTLTQIQATLDDEDWTLTGTWDFTGATVSGIASGLDDLSDITITTAATGHFLRHNGSAWVNVVIQTGDISEAMVTQHEGAITITESQISDLGSYITAAGVTYEQLNSNGDVGTGASQVAAGNHNHTGTYQPFDALLDDIADLTDPGADRILFWDDTAGIVTWLSAGTGITITGTTISASSSAPALDDVTDVVITTPADNEVLAYDIGSGDWINQTAAEAGLATSGHNHTGTYQPLDAGLTAISGNSTAPGIFGAIKQAATTGATGVVEKSTSGENITGTSDTVYPTVAGVKEMIDTHAGGGGAVSVDVSCAWNGVTTTTILKDIGVSSLTDNGTGDTTVNFDSNFPDVNIAIGGMATGRTTGEIGANVHVRNGGLAVGSVRVKSSANGSGGSVTADLAYNSIVISGQA